MLGLFALTPSLPVPLDVAAQPPARRELHATFERMTTTGFTPYFNYDGNLLVSGAVTLESESTKNDTQTFSYSLAGVDPRCLNGAGKAANSCGIHIHKGKSHTTSMHVIKRDGRREPVMFDKITARIKKLCYGFDPKYIDPTVITIKARATTDPRPASLDVGTGAGKADVVVDGVATRRALSLPAIEPRPLAIVLEHDCGGGGGKSSPQAKERSGAALATLRAHGHPPIRLKWQVEC
ncbi:hypothetical protein EMIHUDRAFT_214802 [Emiliania huxleyi CCMP1516]|uniref:ATP-cone domain-containing protein n=2 Tax=Emiliania huxleyi TaxID=2903 RepID=A0A0D3IJI8_EMIH1|nr:hypothetical protein EMIHUDRAFT_214802 [Emiliania huxleyi CCMP1516]EOD11423.1 hypothetical protein EMIHUDRAFT_214802 [Emiliania huxleyi CCMP1516]|eukprot:XP_005763852.1 hypothetical protein EMIHUDRAFT_214802 [Emiliania huxleyi CCMP1516]